MSSFTNVSSRYIEDSPGDLFDGVCISSGASRFLGISVARVNTDDLIQFIFYDQTGTAGSAATPDAGNLLFKMDFAETGARDATPYVMMLPYSTSIKCSDGIVIACSASATGGASDPSAYTVFYQ